MEPVKPPQGYLLNEERKVEDILAMEADLLRSEGIDPAWPGFAADREGEDRKRSRGD